MKYADGMAHASTSVSIGVSTVDAKVKNKGDLYRTADAALYQSKRQGRNTVNIYSNAAAVSIGQCDLTSIPQLANFDQETNPRTGRVLIVDDEAAVSGILELQLRRAKYTDVVVQNEATLAMETIIEKQPDVVILDINMPGINGLEMNWTRVCLIH